MSAQTPTHFPNSGGALVPVDKEHPPAEVEREKEERRKRYPPLTKWLNKTLDAIERLDSHDRTRILESQVKCQAFYDGLQDGEVRNGRWHQNEKLQGEILPEDNQYKIQIDKLHMEMCRADIRFTVEPVDKSSAEMREGAKFYESRLEANRERIETEPFVQSENMSLLLKTIAFRYSFFDSKAEGEGKALKPSFLKTKAGGGQRVAVCRTCGAQQHRAGLLNPDTDRRQQAEVTGMEAAATDEAAMAAAYAEPCKHCGDKVSREIVVSPSEGLDISYEEVPGGSVVTVRPDATMVQLDLSARDIRSSRFLRWRLSLRRCEWEAMFPGRKIPTGKEKSEAGRYQDTLQSAPSNGGWGSLSGDYDEEGGEQFEAIEGDLVWFDPVVYRDYESTEDETYANGKKLPKGAPFIEEYPEGACVVRVGQTILDIYPSDKNKCWAMCVYGLREHALHGAGTLSMLGPQTTVNDYNAFITANAYYNAAAREFMRPGAFADSKLPKINEVGVVTDLDTDKPIVGYAYDKSTPSSLSGEVFQFREQQKGSMQEHAGTSSLSMQGAASDMRALGTATGVEAARDMAVGRMIPNTKLKAAMQREWCYQVGELERENCDPQMFLQRAGKADEKGEVRFTERGVKAFFNADIRRDFIVRPIPGSWMPIAPHQQKANASEFAVVAKQVQNPEILSLLAPHFGIEYDVNEWGAAERAASMRLAEYARVSKIIEEAGFEPSPELADVVLEKCAPWAKISDEMDNHKAFRSFYEEWFMGDEGMKASPLLRMVVERAHSFHKLGDVSQMQDAATGESLAQLPGKLAETATREMDARQQMGLQEEAKDLDDEREMQRMTVMEQAAMAGALPPQN